jgi:hypothetical protein
MSNADFHSRLQRIGADAAIAQPTMQSAPTGSGPAKTKMKVGLFALGSLVGVIGMQAIKYANTNYDAIKAASGAGSAAGLGLGAIATLLVGLFIMLRAVRSKSDDALASPEVSEPKRAASGLARFVSALLGLGLGTIACLFMFMVAAARQIDTEAAQHFSAGGFLIAIILAALALLIGIIGIFLRGYALGRVPIYFVSATILTYAAVGALQIDFLGHPSFTAGLQ